jgi:uncharacterized protein YdeI (BOF family)
MARYTATIQIEIDENDWEGAAVEAWEIVHGFQDDERIKAVNVTDVRAS